LAPLLHEATPDTLLAAVRRMAPEQAVNPLIAFFYHPRPIVRWRAVSAFGDVVARMARTRMESARVTMRRLMWHLNDESGGIGWGAPEAMGETLARSRPLALEFHRILVSYIQPEGNFLEHPILQRGALWAVGRLAGVHPALAADAVPALTHFLQSADAHHRGLAAWAAGRIGDRALAAAIMDLKRDAQPVALYRRWQLEQVAVADLAAEALARLAAGRESAL
jgi:hypothetical protein